MTAPIWLFTGPEIGERNSTIDGLKKKLLAEKGSLDFHLMYAYESNMFDVLNTLQSGSLFDDGTFVVLRSAETIKKKDEIDALEAWVKSSSDSSFLVLVSDEVGIDKRIEKLVPPAQKKIFWEMFENKKQDWIRNFFRKENITIENSAIETILELVENNTEALKTTCEHIALFFDKGYKITEADITQLLDHNKEETVFSLFDAMTCGNFEQSFGILQKLLLAKSSSAVQIIAGLSYCFRRLQDFHNATIAAGRQLDDFALKRIGISSKKAVAQYRRAGNLWSYDKTLRIIALLNATDYELRSLGSALQSTVLEVAIYKIITGKLQRQNYEMLE